jgi:hypothetical protein
MRQINLLARQVTHALTFQIRLLVHVTLSKKGAQHYTDQNHCNLRL